MACGFPAKIHRLVIRKPGLELKSLCNCLAFRYSDTEKRVDCTCTLGYRCDVYRGGKALSCELGLDDGSTSSLVWYMLVNGPIVGDDSNSCLCDVCR
uniref:Uncharacterized protein n=1 Tax=Solanum tuberosum TaxID=4113 RepID=M1DHM8_SOLTU